MLSQTSSIRSATPPMPRNPSADGSTITTAWRAAVQRALGEAAQRGRAVDQHRLVVVLDGGDRLAQAFQRSRLVFLQVGRARQHVDRVGPGRAPDRLPGPRPSGVQDVGHADVERPGVDPEHPGAGRLGVEVDHQHSTPGAGRRRSQAECDGGLADTALLVENRQRPAHAVHGRRQPRQSIPPHDLDVQVECAAMSTL